MPSNKNKEIVLTIIGIVISIAISVLLYNFLHEPLIAVTIGLLGIVITLQIEVILRFDRKLEEHSRYTDLWHMVESSPPLKSIPTIIQSASAALSKFNTDLFTEHASLRLGEVKNYFENLAHGSLRTPYADIEPLILATQRTQSNIRAISIFKLDAWFWNSPIGKRYWEENLNAISRNVRIERIFVCEAMDDNLTKLATKQRQAGVHVYISVGNRMPSNLKEDLIVFDKSFTYKAIVNVDGTAIENDLSTNADYISKKILDFNMAKTYSDEFHLRP